MEKSELSIESFSQELRIPVHARICRAHPTLPASATT